MAWGRGTSAQPRAGEGSPHSLFSSPPILLYPLALMLVEAAKKTWTMTRRLTPWCLPNESVPVGGMAQSTVCIFHLQPPPAACSQLPASLPYFLSYGYAWPLISPWPARLIPFLPYFGPCSSPAQWNCEGGAEARARWL